MWKALVSTPSTTKEFDILFVIENIDNPNDIVSNEFLLINMR